MSDERPPEKKTVELARPPDWAIALTEKVVTGFEHLNDRLDTVESNQDIQGASMREVSKRMTRLEERQDSVEDRLNANSIRAKGTSELDLKQDAAIAQITLDVAAVKTDLAEVRGTVDSIHESVTGFFKSKKVQFVGKVIFGIIMTYAAAKGIKVLP